VASKQKPLRSRETSPNFLWISRVVSGGGKEGNILYFGRGVPNAGEGEYGTKKICAQGNAKCSSKEYDCPERGKR